MTHQQWMAAGLSSVLLIFGVSLLALPTQAAPLAGSQRYVAPSGVNSGACTNPAAPCRTITYALDQSVSGSATMSDTINIASGTYLENLTVTKYIIFQGPTSGSPAIIDGNGSGRVISVSAPRMTVNNLTIRNGNAGTLNGGGIFVSGTGHITVRNSFVINNSAAEGGGIFTNDGATLIIIRSSLQGNRATAGRGGGILANVGATTSITISAVVSNTASGSGGGIHSSGLLTLTNSTVGGNSAGSSGGLYNNGGSVSLNNATIADNTSTSGGGGLATDGGTVQLRNSLLAANKGPSSSPNCSGSLASQGFNLVGNNAGCSFTPSSGDHVGTSSSPINPLIEPLALNYGFTLNYALQPGSLAIDGGNNVAGVGCRDAQGNLLTTDQRGAGRPQGPACDIGSYELGAGPIVTSLTPSSAVVGSGSFTLTADGGNFESGITTVLWDGSPRATTFISTTRVTAAILGTDLGSRRTVPVSVKKTGPNAGISGSLPFTVVGQSQTINFGPLPDRKFGTPPFSVSATASSGLPVSFTAQGFCSVSGRTVTLLGVGSCTITAQQPGDSRWAPAPDVPQTFRITGGVQYIPFLMR